MAKQKAANATIAAYDRYAEEYDVEVVDFWANFPPTTVKAFVDHLPGKYVLDLGSGSGRDAVLLREAGCKVVCLDGSAAMIAMTKALGFESRLVRFEDLVLEKEKYDGIWGYTSLLHITKEIAAEVLAKVGQSIKPNGMLMIGMIEGEFEGMVERENMPNAPRYFRYYSEKELTEMIVPLGFVKIFQERYKPRSKTYLHQVYQKGG